MSHITSENRADFFDKIKPIKAVIKESLEREKSMVATIRHDNSGVEYKKLILCEEMIYVATLYISINTYSLELLDVKNQDALNDARKSIYKAIIYLEEIVSNVVDCPYNELESKLATISNTPIEKRFYLIKKLGFVIQLLSDALGDNTKWKWSFVEIRGRYTAVAKNLVDMKAASKDYFDPSSANYDTTVLYVRLTQNAR